jgi:hypothetical protein
MKSSLTLSAYLQGYQIGKRNAKICFSLLKLKVGLTLLVRKCHLTAPVKTINGKNRTLQKETKASSLVAGSLVACEKIK